MSSGFIVNACSETPLAHLFSPSKPLSVLWTFEGFWNRVGDMISKHSWWVHRRFCVPFLFLFIKFQLHFEAMAWRNSNKPKRKKLEGALHEGLAYSGYVRKDIFFTLYHATNGTKRYGIHNLTRIYRNDFASFQLRRSLTLDNFHKRSVSWCLFQIVRGAKCSSLKQTFPPSRSISIRNERFFFLTIFFFILVIVRSNLT